MKSIRVTIAGVGNRASSLVQGLEYYKDRDDDAFAGLMRHKIGDWNCRKGIARTDLGGGRLDV
jgi:myo-inositol-1-phosphate synthase